MTCFGKQREGGTAETSFQGSCTVQIIGVDSHGPWFFELDGEACVLCDGQRGGYPIIDGEGLLKQVWALLPEP